MPFLSRVKSKLFRAFEYISDYGCVVFFCTQVADVDRATGGMAWSAVPTGQAASGVATGGAAAPGATTGERKNPTAGNHHCKQSLCSTD